MAAAFLGALIGAIADEWDPSLPKGDRLKLTYGLSGSPEGARRQAFFALVRERATSMLLEEEIFSCQ